MKRFFIILLVLVPFAAKAQSYLQIGPAVYPMSAWGGEAVADFKIIGGNTGLSMGIGAMAFASASKTHDEPDAGKRVNEFYAAPQVSVRYGFSERFNIYLRGGAGWLGDKKKGADLNNKFLFNAEAGLGLSLSRHVGLYLEGGLPFSSLGLRFAL